MGRSKQVIVPQCKEAINAMKYELAAEIGLYSPQSEELNTEFAGELGETTLNIGKINWETATTRQVGYIGGSITKRLIQQAEQVLGTL